MFIKSLKHDLIGNISFKLLQLMEPAVSIRVRQEDRGLVESVLSKAQADYKEKIKKDTVLKIDGEHFLSPDTAGGIELIAARGRIKVRLDSN